MNGIAEKFQMQRQACDYHRADQRILLAVRAAVLNLHHKRDPMLPLIRILGSYRAGEALVRMLRTFGEHWPEPIGIELPCCRMVSVDENLIVEMVAAAVGNNRAGFDALLCEMLPQEPRAILFKAVCAFIDPYMAAQSEDASRA